MPHRQSQVRVVVLSRDSTLAGRLGKDENRGNITVVKNLPELQKAMSSRAYDGVIIESNGCKLEEFCALNGSIDLSKKFLLAGPLPTVEALDHLINNSGARQAKSPTSQNSDPNLADYVEAKFSGFVRAMKRGSARDLYPTLMRTVERPLIEFALRETKGNQLQASQLLGMNRNTLRKKIGEFKISVDRYKANHSS
jgi:two-component system nitrogen regulation response regulator GlnG